MSILIIGPEEERLIEAAIAKARADVLPLEALARYGNVDGKPTLMLDERKPGSADLREMAYPPQQIMLGTYRAAFSFEYQPYGLCKHLSVSSRNKGKVPGLEVMIMICEAFGMSGVPLKRPGQIWTEEFEPRRMAINIVELDA